MPVSHAGLLSICCLLVAVPTWSEDALTDLSLISPTSVGTVRVPFGEALDVALPALPTRPGMMAVLRFGAVAYTAAPAGCNFNMALQINRTSVERYMAGGTDRLLGRPATFMLDGRDGRYFSVFSGPRIMLMFAPDVAAANLMTEDDLGGRFLLDVSDLVSGVDGNTLTIVNLRRTNEPPGQAFLLIEDLEVGWLDRSAAPQSTVELPQRGEIARRISSAGLTLAQGDAGGFSLAIEDGPELLVETAIGMTRDVQFPLLAQDEVAEAPAVSVGVRPQGPDAFEMEAEWPQVRLHRTLRLRDGLVEWTERWTNLTDEIIGLPFRHRVFLRGDAARFALAGDYDIGALAGCATNPTLFLESQQQSGKGFGITGESDWLRLLMWLRGEGGIGEIFTRCLALPPRGAIDFELTISPVADGGGYWTFINRLRERWGVNDVTMERPFFWSFEWAAGDTTQDRLRKSLGHLGPVYVTSGHWMRLTADAVAARTGAYPKLAPGADPTPGGCPDLDLDEFLKFAHRERWWQSVIDTMAQIRQACPNVKVINMLHPAMEVVYTPLARRFPISAEVIQTAGGDPFAVHHYSVAHLRDAVQRDWAVYYYCPRPGSRYLETLLVSCRRSMDIAGSDGVYCDEFSWAGRSRGYSRYDYSRWDGYSADLDAEGRVTRLKSDNAYVTESCQLRIAHECLSRGKFLLGNGGSALRSINSLPVQRFIEGGNGHGTMAGGHLSPVPLVLGNFGDRASRTGVFEGVKQCLTIGCIYSPTAANLLVEGDDNFICKLYPITIQHLGPGWVAGKERLATTVSGAYDWPGREAEVRLYQYDARGDLISSDQIMHTSTQAPTAITVPESGLVIAEIVNG